MLQDGEYPNCSGIAEELEVSIKTAARDVEFMRDRWGLPIEYDQQRHGYYFAKPVERALVTEAELFAVCVTQKVVEAYKASPLHKPLKRAFAKLAQCLDNEEKGMLAGLDQVFSCRPYAPEDPDLKLLDLLAKAVAWRRELRFTYRKPGDKDSETRTVHPYHILEHNGRMYLVAFDPAREAVRTFAVGRMSDLSMTEAKFTKPRDFSPDEQFRSSLGVMTGEGDYQVVIAMDAWLTDVLRGRRLHPSQVIEELPGGGAHLKLRLSGLEEVQNMVLGWGSHATVVGPGELRKRMFEVTEDLRRKYAAP